MKIPTILTTKISEHFYDKSVECYSVESYKTTKGFVKNRLGSLIETFNGNVNFSELARIQEDYGIETVIDIAITCSTDTLAGLGNVLKYAGEYYKVTKAIPFDSHKLIVGEKWSLESSTSTSV